MSYEEFQQKMIVYAKSIQGYYLGDEYYLQECWKDAWKDGLTPEEAVDSDMSYWEPESTR